MSLPPVNTRHVKIQAGELFSRSTRHVASPAPPEAHTPKKSRHHVMPGKKTTIKQNSKLQKVNTNSVFAPLFLIQSHIKSFREKMGRTGSDWDETMTVATTGHMLYVLASKL